MAVLAHHAASDSKPYRSLDLNQIDRIRNVFLLTNQPGCFVMFTHRMVVQDLRDAFLICPFGWDQLVAQAREFFLSRRLPGEPALQLLNDVQRDGRLWSNASEESVNRMLAHWGYPAVSREIFAVGSANMTYRQFAFKKTGLRPVSTLDLDLAWQFPLVLIEEEVRRLL
jgi:hypothetical protein